MGLFYKISDKKLLEVRNGILKKKGLIALKNNGFEQSPYTASWFGKNNLGDYIYDFCRINERSNLEIVSININRGDSWIQIYLNIFHLNPTVTSLQQLKGLDGMQFGLPPNSISRMRLRIDDYEGMLVFQTIEHKIKTFYTESGFQSSVDDLEGLIETDLNNIDAFVKNWHKLHTPMATDWEGNQIKK